jgi:hypothetical protein
VHLVFGHAEAPELSGEGGDVRRGDRAEAAVAAPAGAGNYHLCVKMGFIGLAGGGGGLSEKIVVDRRWVHPVGDNAVVVKSVPPDSVVVGVPGQVIHRRQPRAATAPVDLDHTLLPDLVGISLHALLVRIEELEAKADGAAHPRHPATSEVWYEQDFSI